MTSRLALLLVAAATASAHAESLTITRLEPAQAIAGDGHASSAPRSWDGRLGMLLGGADVGNADGFSVGVSAGAGYRIGDATLRGLFDYYKVGDDDHHGRGTRLGGALRYSFANTGNDAGVGVDFWGEAGLGYEHVAWLAGGVLDRPSAEVAFGFEVNGRGDRDRDGRRHYIGYFMAFRSLVGEAPGMDGPAVCGGPCTKATQPSRTDISMFFELGLHWGH